ANMSAGLPQASSHRSPPGEGGMMSTGECLLRQENLDQVRQSRYARRKRVNQIALMLSLLAMSFGLFWLFWILFETARLGVGGLSVATLTQMTPPPNDAGGLANAMVGSFLMVLLATCIGTPIGMLAGIYLAEFETRGWLANT